MGEGSYRRRVHHLAAPTGLNPPSARDAPLPCWWAGSVGSGLGSPMVSVWLNAPCHVDGLGGVAAGTVGHVDL